MPKKHERADGQTSMTISLPADLLAKIDARAAASKRTRSNWVVVKLEEILEEQVPGKKLTAPKALPAHSASDAPTADRSSVSPSGLNEDPPPRPRGQTAGPRARSTGGIKRLTPPKQ